MAVASLSLPIQLSRVSACARVGVPRPASLALSGPGPCKGERGGARQTESEESDNWIPKSSEIPSSLGENHVWIAAIPEGDGMCSPRPLEAVVLVRPADPIGSPGKATSGNFVSAATDKHMGPSRSLSDWVSSPAPGNHDHG